MSVIDKIAMFDRESNNKKYREEGKERVMKIVVVIEGIQRSSPPLKQQTSSVINYAIRLNEKYT